MRWIKAVAAVGALVAGIVIPPVLLTVLVGNPIPYPTSTGLSDDDLVSLLSLLVWAFWLQTTWCIGAETRAALSSRRLQRVRGTFSFQTFFVRAMLAAILGALSATPLTSSPSQAQPASNIDGPRAADDLSESAIPTPSPEVLEQATQAGPRDQAVSAVVVGRGDSLWALAQTHLGDGERWAEIAAANTGRTMNDGTTFDPNGYLRPGWQLDIPTDPPAPIEATLSSPDYTVREGDTLSAVARDHLGDAHRYPEIFEASAQIDQPVPLTDPDLIYPGQQLDLTPTPSVAPSVAAPDEVTTAEPSTGPTVHVAPVVTEGATQGAASTLSDAEPPTIVQLASSDEEANEASVPSWVWPGLISGGALLSAGFAISLRQRRATQHRYRTPGFVFTPPDPWPGAAEKSIHVAGTPRIATLEHLDQVVRRLAQRLIVERSPIPALAAIELTSSAIALHLRRPASAPEPWIETDDKSVWVVDIATEVNQVGPDPHDSISPWPLLSTIGTDDRGSTWLLNLEVQPLTVAGDAQRARDFLRHVAAEVACNPWSRHTRIDVVGIGEEIVPIDPERIRTHSEPEALLAEMIAVAGDTIERLRDGDEPDLPTARATGSDPDPWPERLVVIAKPEKRTQSEGSVEAVADATGMALLLHRPSVDYQAEITIESSGRLHLPDVGLTLVAVGLTEAEASGCATLLSGAEDVREERAPALDHPAPWAQAMTTTGSLRQEHRTARASTSDGGAASVLTAADEIYVRSAATTVDDLAELAPKVTLAARQLIHEVDPNLDVDLLEWETGRTTRPRITLLGPVYARTVGAPLEKRIPYYTELLAFLATRPHGATPEEVAADFDITPGRVRTDIHRLREWLGAAPGSGGPYLPGARSGPAAQRRGVPVYEVTDSLLDLDLFRRLRVRGESRGSEGLVDLRKALALVEGRPFDKLRPGGWGWVFEGERLDQHAVCAVADVAHVIVTDCLERDDSRGAREAIDVALRAAPDEEMVRLDLAAVLVSEGHADEAGKVLGEDVFNRSDDGEAPDEIANRTARVLTERPDLTRRAV